LKTEDQKLETIEQITDQPKRSRVLIRNLVFLVLWATIFTLAYAQSPLYTSNQNQYFLQGLARSGFGFLSEDWLVSTLDPTPVFSKFIEISWRFIPWQPVFYLYYGILAGIYLFSISGIANQIWHFTTRAQRWLFLSILVILHSAALRYIIVSLFGPSWDYLLDGGVAGQRLLGTVLQPSTFGVFLILSIYLFLRTKKYWAILCLLVATTFHPTYLLSAGILTAIYMGITFWETREIRAPLALGLFALIGVSPILWNTLTTFGGTSPVITAQARKILVEFRIPHHALVTEWFDASVLVKLGFIGLALILLYRRKQQVTAISEVTVTSPVKLFHIILWPSLIAIALTLLQVFTDNVILSLLFPWRLSTWLVPLSLSMMVGWLANWAFRSFHFVSFSHRVLAGSLIVTLIFAIAGIIKFNTLWKEKHTAPDRPMMAYVEANKKSGDIYLIPIDMQDFRLETGAPVFTEFKSIPYKDSEVLEWRRRVELARKFYAQPRCKQFRELYSEEGITHIVLQSDHEAIGCKRAKPVYQDDDYGVFEILHP
jgi:hypothetical protein